MIYYKKDTDPYYPYYYFHQNSKQEAFIIHGNDLEQHTTFVDFEETTCSMGNVLCKFLNIIFDIENTIKTFESDSIINDTYPDEEHITLTIKNIIKKYLSEDEKEQCINDSIKLFIEYDLFRNDISKFDFNNDNLNEILNCFRFIELATADKRYSNVNDLIRFSQLVDIPIKNSFTIAKDLDVGLCEYRLETHHIKSYLDSIHEELEKIKNEDFYSYQHQDNFCEMFSVTSSSDFMLTCFKFMLLNHITINKCKICGHFFIAERSDTKYCSGTFLNNSNHTCAYVARRRLSKLDKTYFNICQMIRVEANENYENGNSTRGNELSDKLEELQKTNQEMKAKCKNYEITPQQYKDWLETYHKRKPNTEEKSNRKWVWDK